MSKVSQTSQSCRMVATLVHAAMCFFSDAAHSQNKIFLHVMCRVLVAEVKKESIYIACIVYLVDC